MMAMVSSNKLKEPTGISTHVHDALNAQVIEVAGLGTWEAPLGGELTQMKVWTATGYICVSGYFSVEVVVGDFSEEDNKGVEVKS